MAREVWFLKQKDVSCIQRAPTSRVRISEFWKLDLWDLLDGPAQMLPKVLFPGKDHLDMLRRIAATLGWLPACIASMSASQPTPVFRVIPARFSIEHDLHWVPEKDMAQA